MPRGSASEDALYEQATTKFGAALGRLAYAYEVDRDKQRDLLQEIHLALWRSFSGFKANCSLRTWVYRVAHNVAASHVAGQRRSRSRLLVTLDELDQSDAGLTGSKADASFDRQRALDRLHALIHRLQPLDRQIILLYLEGSDAAAIGEISGVSPGNVATKIHRIKRVLAERYQTGSTT
jgi:RNA polymerase sigma-70 factor (ECF subfamily)